MPQPMSSRAILVGAVALILHPVTAVAGKAGTGPLSQSIQNGKSLSGFQQLLENGADPLQADADGDTVVHYAAGTRGPAKAASREKLEVIDSGTRSEWVIDEHAWGGGVRLYFPNAKHKSGPPDLTPNFALGCDSIDPAKSVWRFLVELAPLGSDASGEEETAYMKNKAYYFGAPGTAILFDEMDKEFKRVPIRATAWETLESGYLTREEVTSFTDASLIRVETPRVVFETRALRAGSLHLMRKLPCAAP